MGIGSFFKDIAGAVIGAGGALAGGAMSGKTAKKINAQNIQMQRETNAINVHQAELERAMQLEFAKMGVRWKVADAQAAGLHPLYALGGSTATYSPVIPALTAPQNTVVPDTGRGIADASQEISRAIQAHATPEERMSRLLQLRAVQSQIKVNDAQAMLYASEAKRAEQEANAAKPIPLSGYSNALPFQGVQALAPFYDSAIGQSDQVISQRENADYIGAGSHAAFREYSIGPGRKALLLFSEEGPGESLESTPSWMWPYIIQVNREYYGSQWDPGILDLIGAGAARGAMQLMKLPRGFKHGKFGRKP